MSPAVILLGLIVLPVVLLMGLRINATLVFLSLCLGEVLLRFVGDDVKWFADSFMPHASVGADTMKLVLLLFPVTLTALFMIRTLHGRRLMFNTLPAAGVGLLLALLVVPLLPPDTARAITSSDIWHQVQRSQDLIVGLSALICLSFLWLQRPRAKETHKRH